jgi:LuxR family transcriptional regulator, maltose regulon positive regulatory protein
MVSVDAGGEAISEGVLALEHGAWAQASAAFGRAVEAGAGPEALEGLATAAFFLDEPQVVFDARERAYAAFVAAGRRVDAARVATALAWDYRIFKAEPAVGDGWLARARRLLESAGQTPERGWLALREASFALPADATVARERCAEAEAIGRELGDVDLEMTAVALDGLARVSQGEVAAGMARLDEATTAATAGEMRDPMAIGFSCCYLIFACERVRDFDRAGQWCERLARMSAGWNIRALSSVCRTHYGSVLMLRGDWHQAEVELTEAAAALAARPGEGTNALARLAELRRRQGRAAEAEALITRAEHHPLALLCRAAMSLDGGDLVAGGECAARYLRVIGDAQTERAPGLELLIEALAQAGRTGDAAAAARELRALAQSAGTDPLLGATRHAEGLVHEAAGELDAAREAFEDAIELLGRAGLPFEAARARIALARALRSLGRDDEARSGLERAAEALRALGASGEERQLAGLAAAEAVVGARPSLSPREQEVLTLVAQGRTNCEIAATLVVSEHTVHRHVANILAKLGCSSRAAAVARAADQGLL